MAISQQWVLLRLLEQGITNLSLQPSVSLQHLPYDLALETDLPVGLGGRLSFATQKLADLVALSVSDAAARVQPKHLAPEGILEELSSQTVTLLV